MGSQQVFISGRGLEKQFNGMGIFRLPGCGGRGKAELGLRMMELDDNTLPTSQDENIKTVLSLYVLSSSLVFSIYLCLELPPLLNKM